MSCSKREPIRVEARGMSARGGRACAPRAPPSSHIHKFIPPHSCNWLWFLTPPPHPSKLHPIKEADLISAWQHTKASTRKERNLGSPQYLFNCACWWKASETGAGVSLERQRLVVLLLVVLVAGCSAHPGHLEYEVGAFTAHFNPTTTTSLNPFLFFYGTCIKWTSWNVPDFLTLWSMTTNFSLVDV